MSACGRGGNPGIAKAEMFKTRLGPAWRVFCWCRAELMQQLAGALQVQLKRWQVSTPGPAIGPEHAGQLEVI